MASKAWRPHAEVHGNKIVVLVSVRARDSYVAQLRALPHMIPPPGSLFIRVSATAREHNEEAETADRNGVKHHGGARKRVNFQ